MKQLSILIPTYNHNCLPLVSALQEQASALGAAYEIVVADDGSSLADALSANRTIASLPCCRYLERGHNTGRAAIRNFLAREAHYDWLLFIDNDMVVSRADYLRCYAESTCDTVAYGGYTVDGDARRLRRNLRFRYEQAAAPQHTAVQRRLKPYQDFHTCNFLVRRDIMLRIPFDERFRHYGYEDVLFGKQLQEHGVAICHMDNPLSFQHFESNASFLAKMEEGLRTLHEFRNELRGYSRLIRRTESLPATWPLRCFHRLCGPVLRRWLEHRPALPLFTLYRLTYFASLPA